MPANAPMAALPDPHGLNKKKDSILKLPNLPNISVANKLLLAYQKEIKISGINSIVDTLITKDPTAIYYRGLPLHQHDFRLLPVNNADGIIAATQFNDDGTYNYEIAIPLKHLKAGFNGTDTFNYKIVINGRSEDERVGSSFTYLYERGADGLRHPVLQNADLETATDFYGEYTLAKKP